MSADFPSQQFNTLNLQWAPQVLNNGTTVVWTHTGGGTGNFDTPKRVFGFTIGAVAQSGTATLSTSGFVHDPPCNALNNFDTVGPVVGPTGAVPQIHVLPVVGSTQGFGGSFFRTSVQLYNPRVGFVAGKIVFHTQNVSGTSSDPSVTYNLAGGQTVTFNDLLPAMGVATPLRTTPPARPVTSRGSGRRAQAHRCCHRQAPRRARYPRRVIRSSGDVEQRMRRRA